MVHYQCFNAEAMVHYQCFNDEAMVHYQYNTFNLIRNLKITDVETHL